MLFEIQCNECKGEGMVTGFYDLHDHICANCNGSGRDEVEILANCPPDDNKDFINYKDMTIDEQRAYAMYHATGMLGYQDIYSTGEIASLMDRISGATSQAHLTQLCDVVEQLDKYNINCNVAKVVLDLYPVGGFAV